MGGKVLVFEHVERFVFKVYIIGLDGCEIEYPPIVHSSQSSGPITVCCQDIVLCEVCFELFRRVGDIVMILGENLLGLGQLVKR
ncbi:hypothetical protein ACET3Z_018050 [Daucus carota]